jgi:hypothetical protein
MWASALFSWARPVRIPWLWSEWRREAKWSLPGVVGASPASAGSTPSGRSRISRPAVWCGYRRDHDRHARPRSRALLDGSNRHSVRRQSGAEGVAQVVEATSRTCAALSAFLNRRPTRPITRLSASRANVGIEGSRPMGAASLGGHPAVKPFYSPDLVRNGPKNRVEDALGLSPGKRGNPRFPGVSDAAEWSRTITGVSTHKALNLARLPVPPQPLEGGRF